jgi:hypothetical protein
MGLWLCVRSKIKKVLSLIFLFSRSMSNKHGVGPFQRSKKTLPSGFKGKKTFAMIFYFHVLCRTNAVLVGFKSQKNIFYDFSTFRSMSKNYGPVRVRRSKSIFYFRVEYREYMDCSSSKVMVRISETISIETSRCYAFPQDDID